MSGGSDLQLWYKAWDGRANGSFVIKSYNFNYWSRLLALTSDQRLHMKCKEKGHYSDCNKILLLLGPLPNMLSEKLSSHTVLG